jgi:hypothetical protein
VRDLVVSGAVRDEESLRNHGVLLWLSTAVHSGRVRRQFWWWSERCDPEGHDRRGAEGAKRRRDREARGGALREEGFGDLSGHVVTPVADHRVERETNDPHVPGHISTLGDDPVQRRNERTASGLEEKWETRHFTEAVVNHVLDAVPEVLRVLDWHPSQPAALNDVSH